MSDSNLTSLFIAEETAYNEVPDNGSTLQEIRWTGDNISPQKGTLESAEIRSERDLREIIQVSESSDGGFTIELTAGDPADLLQAVMMGTWATSTDTHTGTFSSAGQTFTLDSGTFSAALQGAKLIKIEDAATAGHNGVHRIVSITSTVITFKAGTITVDDASDEVDLTYNYVRNANTHRTFLIEKHYDLDTDYYLGFSGRSFGEMVLTAEPGQAMTLTFNGMGGRVNKGAATFGDGSPSSPSTNPIFDSANDIEEVLISGTDPECTNRLEFTVTNNLRDRMRLGSLYSKKHGKGRFLVNGQLDLYFDSGDELTNFLNHTSRSLQLVLADSDGNKYSFFMPAVEWTAGNAPTDSVDSDVIAPLQFGAVNGGTSSPYALQIDYVAAA